MTIVAADQQHELVQGSLTVGRSPNADFVIEDALVSRFHARVVVRDDGVVIEDLNSTNGVYMDGIRLPPAAQRLREGDRVLIGTHELSFFSGGNVRSLKMRSEEATPRVLPPGSVARTLVASEQIPPTDRADVGELVSRLAERFKRAGKSADATRVLSAHLHQVLWGITTGSIDAIPSLVEEASRQAMQLFAWTENPAWIDYVIELHLAIRRVLSEDALAAIEAAALAPKGKGFDAPLLRTYIGALESRGEGLSLMEQARVLRLYILHRSAE
ncbi:MAG: FHA domain-containing protein [Myxococcota bacterium]